MKILLALFLAANTAGAHTITVKPKSPIKFKAMLERLENSTGMNFSGKCAVPWAEPEEDGGPKVCHSWAPIHGYVMSSSGQVIIEVYERPLLEDSRIVGTKELTADMKNKIIQAVLDSLPKVTP